MFYFLFFLFFLLIIVQERSSRSLMDPCGGWSLRLAQTTLFIGSENADTVERVCVRAHTRARPNSGALIEKF